MHIRRQLITQIRDQLKSANEFSAVWIQRAIPKRATFPCITLYAETESVEHLQIQVQPRDQDRDLFLTVVIWIRGTPDDERTEERMDEFAEIAEQSIRMPTGADDLVLLSTEFQLDEEQPDIHAVILSYEISYTTVEFLPTI